MIYSPMPKALHKFVAMFILYLIYLYFISIIGDKLKELQDCCYNICSRSTSYSVIQVPANELNQIIFCQQENFKSSCIFCIGSSHLFFHCREVK